MHATFYDQRRQRRRVDGGSDLETRKGKRKLEAINYLGIYMTYRDCEVCEIKDRRYQEALSIEAYKTKMGLTADSDLSEDPSVAKAKLLCTALKKACGDPVRPR